MVLKIKRFFIRVGTQIYRTIRRRRRVGRSAEAVIERAVFLAELEADKEPCASPVVALIVPVWNTPTTYLEDLVASVRLQRPGSWQLVLSDDGSTNELTRAWLSKNASAPDLTIIRNAQNRGIVAATNAGIKVASAPWVGFLDHDDALVPHAIDRIIKAIDSHPECMHIYTDEVVVDGRLKPVDIFLKPAFDPVLLTGVNYLNHLSLYRRERLISLGGLREGFDGSQDYELALRYTSGLRRGDSLHVPYPAYLWRRDGVTYSTLHLEKATSAARRAIESVCDEIGGPGPIKVDEAISPDLHRIRFDLQRQDWPLVSVIIPNRNGFELVSQVLNGLSCGTDYPRLEIVVIDNGSNDPRVLELYNEWRQAKLSFRVEIKHEPFNFSRAINRGIATAHGDYVLLLNNDVEVIDPNWLKEMVSCFAWHDTAIVGAKLLYPNQKLQHVGVIAGLGGLAGHWFIQQEKNFPGPMGRLWVRQSLSAVTGACMLISRQALDRLGPFNETEFAVAYNDVDFCLRAVAAGMRVVWTPFATLVHHESATRGSDETSENIERFRREQGNLAAKHQTANFEDLAFNPWYAKTHSYPAPICLDRLPSPR